MNKYTDEQKNKIKNVVLESLKNGVSITKACEAANIAVSTFWIWRNEDEEFNNQVFEAKDSRVDIVEDALFVNATGYEVVDKDGKKKTIRGDTAAQIFFLKNRSKGRWKDKQEIEHSGKVELNKEETNELIDLAERAIQQLKSNDKDNKKGS